MKRQRKDSDSVGEILRALLDVPPGSRHGRKVFHVRDPKRVVGEVILEHLHGRIEAIISSEIITGRSNLFVLAPESKSIGENVDLSIPLPKRLSKHFATPSPAKTTPSAGSSKKNTHSTSDVKEPRTGRHPIHVLAKSAKLVSKGSRPEIVSSSQKTQTEKEPQRVSSSPRVSVGDARNTMKKDDDNVPIISLEKVFYWSCERCTCCGGRKSISATKLTSAVDSLKIISLEDQSTIPISILYAMLKIKPKSAADGRVPYELPLEMFFKWICGKCTAINSYTAHKCTVCENYRTFASKCSTLLDIACKAAYSSHSVKDAMSLIPIIHQMSIPETVLESLMTCSEVIGRTPQEKRRCLRTRVKGMNFCSLHCDPHQSPEKLESHEDEDASKSSNRAGTMPQPKSESPLNDSSNDNPSSTSSKPLQDESHVVLLKTMREFFSKNRDPPLNCRQWKILSIEDAILCQEKSPFPLGMLVRRFFPRYGFHDGCITFVQRKLLFEEQKGTSRPVLVYRVKYQGGDEEDFMHHEVNSLRQIYDVRNVLETAPPSSQLPTNMVLECQNETTVKIIKNMTPPGTKNPKEGGRVQVYVSKNGSSWAKTELDLTELQLNVIRKYEVGESLNGSMSSKLDLTHPEHSEVSSPSHSGYTLLAPTIEWPSGVSFRSDSEVPEENECNIENSKNQLSPLDEKKEWKLSSGLYLGRETSNFGTKIRSTSIDMDDQPDVLLLNNQPCVRKNISRVSIWDPTHISNYLSWDPYRSVVCEICKVDENDHQILICDRCHQGYHMYCLRPIIVTVPTNEWLCSKCSPESSSRQPFQEIIKSLQQTPHQMTKFLFLPFCNPKEFFVKHEKELELFGPNGNVSKRQSIIGNLRSRSTVKIWSLSFSCNPRKNDWLLPLPLPSLNLYESSLASMVAAMRHCGMDSSTEDLVYAGDGVSEAMNNASLDKVQPMSRRNIEIFKEFKENLKNGAFPPIKIVFDSEIGFTVEALIYIPRHTLIAEYVGEVTTLERSGETSSDSLMILLDTEDPQTSLIIDPTRTGNAARFLSGINNLSNMSKQKANVRTRRFELDGKCRVALFTAKKVEAGDQLYYDYNAGMIGKDVVDWAKNGFYDTRNFF